MSPRPAAVADDRLALAPAPEPARRSEGVRPAEPRVRRAVTPRRPTWQVGTLAGVVLFLALFAIAGAQALIVQQQRHIDQVDDRISTAEQEAEQLRSELAELQSPERIIREATEDLGMVDAPSPVYVQPSPGDDARAAEVPPASPTTTAGPAATAGR